MNSYILETSEPLWLDLNSIKASFCCLQQGIPYPIYIASNTVVDKSQRKYVGTPVIQ